MKLHNININSTNNPTSNRNWDYIASIKKHEDLIRGLGASPEDAVADLIDNLRESDNVALRSLYEE